VTPTAKWLRRSYYDIRNRGYGPGSFSLFTSGRARQRLDMTFRYEAAGATLMVQVHGKPSGQWSANSVARLVGLGFRRWKSFDDEIALRVRMRGRKQLGAWLRWACGVTAGAGIADLIAPPRPSTRPLSSPQRHSRVAWEHALIAATVAIPWTQCGLVMRSNEAVRANGKTVSVLRSLVVARRGRRQYVDACINVAPLSSNQRQTLDVHARRSGYQMLSDNKRSLVARKSVDGIERAAQSLATMARSVRSELVEGAGDRRSVKRARS
jgi:hypothetical protein